MKAWAVINYKGEILLDTIRIYRRFSIEALGEYPCYNSYSFMDHWKQWRKKGFKVKKITITKE